jgi:hypothetical protein
VPRPSSPPHEAIGATQECAFTVDRVCGYGAAEAHSTYLAKHGPMGGIRAKKEQLAQEKALQHPLLPTVPQVTSAPSP